MPAWDPIVYSMACVPLHRYRSYERQGLLRSQSHPSLPLLIWNYTDKAQYMRRWDDVTTAARALVTDKSGRVVARSFPKFFNLGETDEPPPDEDYVVQNKLDGSLGLIFHYRGRWHAASRGSFTSEQALRAQRLLNTRYKASALDPQLAYSVEILYPENRIVVDYGAREALVYLAAFDRQGREHFPDVSASGLESAEVYGPQQLGGATKLASLKALGWQNHEGFVVRYRGGRRLKVKLPGYLALHGSVAAVTDTAVWRWYRTGKPLEEVAEGVHDELLPLVRTKWLALQTAHDRIRGRLQEVYDMLPKTDRRSFAAAAGQRADAQMLFMLYDGKPVHEPIADMLRPNACARQVNT